MCMPLSIENLDGIPFDGQIPESSKKVSSWKTKDVFNMGNGILSLQHNWVLTAFDDPEFTGVAPEKWVASTYATSLIFKKIEAVGIPTSHQGILNKNTTLETELDMLPYEIIWRRYNVAGNSWVKRHPNTQYATGEKYEDIIYEVCLKWSIRDTNGEMIHDPFLVLDTQFQPLLDDQGLPELTHSKTGKLVVYDTVIDPNTKKELSLEVLRDSIEVFSQHGWDIYDMVQRIQEITFMTYAGIGRVNADGKIEVWLDSQWKPSLWDELELDSTRNMNVKEIEINGSVYEFEGDILWKNLGLELGETPQKITRIIEARHSGKQAYRDEVAKMRDAPYDETRKAFNNAVAEEITQTIYIPTAQALSDNFWKKVGYILVERN